MLNVTIYNDQWLMFSYNQQRRHVKYVDNMYNDDPDS